MTTAGESYRFSETFEAELLVELMLRFRKHPLDDHAEFRNALIESANTVLQASVAGERLLDDVPPSQMNFVAAVWYVEWTTLQNADQDLKSDELPQRQDWLLTVRRSLPSCFCDQGDLGT